MTFKKGMTMDDAYVVRGTKDYHIWSGTAHDYPPSIQALFLLPKDEPVPPALARELDLYGPLSLEDMRREVVRQGGSCADTVDECGEHDAGPCYACGSCAEQLPIGWPY